jgi:hypothetical protein
MSYPLYAARCTCFQAGGRPSAFFFPGIGRSEAKNGPGSNLFSRYFLGVFFNPPHRKTPKTAIKQIEKKIDFEFLSIVL